MWVCVEKEMWGYYLLMVAPLLPLSSHPPADLCRDRFSKCGIMATSGLCQTMATSCARSCGGC